MATNNALNINSSTPLAASIGGTGVSNTNTMTLSGGNLTLTMTGATNVTLPTSGTLIASGSGGTQHITTGNFQVDAGFVASGLASGGFVGLVEAFPTTAASGYIAMEASVNGSGDFGTKITNATTQAQNQTITIPDSGGATANFLLSESAAASQSINTGLSIVGGNNVQTSGGGNFLAGASGAAGAVYSYPSTATSGSLGLVAVDNGTGDFDTTISNAIAVAQDQTITIPDCGGPTSDFVLTDTASGIQSIATGISVTGAGKNVQTFGGGSFVAGSAGVSGTFVSYPATAGNGNLIVEALDAGGAFNTTIRNSAMGQSSVVSIPDPGAATANFLLDAGNNNLLTMQEFVGLQNVLNYSAGTWTRTRLAQGDYAQVKTQANDTTIIGIDVTPMIRTAASKGFRLDSFDVIYSIATLALDAHTVTLDRIAYANNVAVSVTAIPITATLATATQANPYVTNAAVNTPAFDNTADSKYVIEVTVDAGTTSDYSFYGIMLHFTQTIA